MRTLALRFGLSDLALRKACARAHIPTPDRGYWAKRDSGKPTRRDALAPRAPGMDDEVDIGGGNRWYQNGSREALLAPIPPEPEFEDTIETIRARIVKEIGKVTVPRDVHIWHPVIERLLADDEKRQQKPLSSPNPAFWDAPRFNSPSARRRLRILNSLFLATATMGGKPAIQGREARNIRLVFYHQHVEFTLDPPKSQKVKDRSSDPALSTDQLCLTIHSVPGSMEVRHLWADDDLGKLESRMTEIAVDFILTAELLYRERVIQYRKWRIQRKAQIEAQDRKSRAEAERVEDEKQKRLEQASIDRLLKDAAAFHQANQIRDYIAGLTSKIPQNGNADMEEFERWKAWALTQADRIDPAVNKTYLNTQDEH